MSLLHHTIQYSPCVCVPSSSSGTEEAEEGTKRTAGMDAGLFLASCPDHSQILSRSHGEIFFNGCKIKSGSGLGTRLDYSHVQLQWLVLCRNSGPWSMYHFVFLLPQDVTHKLCEALSVTANVGLAQNYVVVGNKSSGSEEEETSDSTEGLVTSVQQNQVQNKTEYQTHASQSAASSVERNTPPSHSTSTCTTGSPVTPPLEHNQVPSVSDGAPPSPTHHKNERSAASVRAAIGREEDKLNVDQSLGKQQFSCVVSNEMQLPAIQALAVLSNVSIY